MSVGRALLGVAFVACLFGQGCFTTPERDARWSAQRFGLEESEVQYARAKKGNATAVVVVGWVSVILTAVVGGVAGVAAELTGSEEAVAVYVGALCTGGGMMAYVEWAQKCRRAWDRELSRLSADRYTAHGTSGASPKGELHDSKLITDGAVRRDDPRHARASGSESPCGPTLDSGQDGRSRRVRLYLPTGHALPPGGGHVEVIRVSGPADPIAARLAGRVTVLRWPILEIPVGEDGESTLSVGGAAVESLLSAGTREWVMSSTSR